MPIGSDGNQSQDVGEKYDPAAAIWEAQRRKEAQAAEKKHEAKHAQLDQVRKQVKLQETKGATDTWKEAEAALDQVLKGKRHEAAKAQLDPDRDDGLRKTGQNVTHRRLRAIKQQAPQGSPPLQRASRREADDGGFGATGGSGSEGEETMEFGDGSGSGSACGSPSSRATARASCFGTKSQLLRQKAKGPTEMLAGHARRRLRAKIAMVLIEVRKRQELHQLQEKAKKFREQRFASGRGPYAFVGDTTEFALGLTCLSETSKEQDMTSPRRTALLESLTTEELAIMREDPTFFFTGNAIAAAMKPEQSKAAASIDDRTHSFAGSSGSLSSTSPAPKSLWQGSVPSEAFEDLIEFFSVSTADKNLDVNAYARNLRAQLLASAGRHNVNGGGLSSEIDWRKRLCRSDPNESAQEEQPTVEETLPKPPLEMMPCLGRHPPIRADQESPTLEKVRAVYQKRDEQDAQWVDERREAIARRLALNAFKAREQQRELLLQDFKQKELHKVRMLQAEEKKAMLEAEAVDRTEVMGIQKIHRLMCANERAERLTEEKRDHAQVTLEAWHAGVQRAQQHTRKLEREKRKEGQRNHEKYMQRLQQVGESRLGNKDNRSQGQLNDELKGKIQTSLVAQIQEQEEEKGRARAEEIKQKLEAAAIRRHVHQSGSRYSFVEKAFGVNAAGFDCKHHSIAVDRRSRSWQKSSEAWNKTKGSFSTPSLPPASPLSPGGTLDEEAFKTLRDSGAFSRCSNQSLRSTASAAALA